LIRCLAGLPLPGGRVGIYSPSFNVYSVTLQHDGCTGPETAFNGSTLDGFAVLDDTETPEALIVAVIGSAGDRAVSLFERAERQ
jgi:hypothetical protein